jgi:hypothetical protein
VPCWQTRCAAAGRSVRAIVRGILRVFDVSIVPVILTKEGTAQNRCFVPQHDKNEETQKDLPKIKIFCIRLESIFCLEARIVVVIEEFDEFVLFDFFRFESDRFQGHLDCSESFKIPFSQFFRTDTVHTNISNGFFLGERRPK